MRQALLLIAIVALSACHRVPELSAKPHAMTGALDAGVVYVEATTRLQAGAIPELLRRINGESGTRRAYRGHRPHPVGGTFADGGFELSRFDSTAETWAQPHPSDPNRWLVPLPSSHDAWVARREIERCRAGSATLFEWCGVAAGFALETARDPSWDGLTDGGRPWWSAVDGGAVPVPPDNFPDDAGVTANDSGPEGGR